MRQAAKKLQLSILIAVVFACSWCTNVARAQEDLTFGTWALGSPAPGHKLATHSTLLRNNKILVVSGSSYNCCYAWGKEDTRYYDIATDSWSALLGSPAPYASNLDPFCSAHAHDTVAPPLFPVALVNSLTPAPTTDNPPRST